MFRLFLQKLIEYLYFKQEGNLALYDQLTGVYNYNWFNLVGNSKYINKHVYITVIDINGFKQINDTKGHLHGNNILKEVADKLMFMKAYDKSIDVVRYGGDEFVIISEQNPSSLLDIYSDREKLISYGVVEKKDTDPLSVAFVRADEKMYRYKQEFKKRNKELEENKELRRNP